MTNLLPETHTALNKTIKGVAYTHETEKLDITTQQLKGVVGSLINKGALDVESRGDTEAEKAIWGQDLWWLNETTFKSLIAK